MSLYLKYRPKDFRSLVGQKFVRVCLQNALTSGSVAGAYLFHGPRGTGKTSVARIFAKGLNCTNLSEDGNPCGACANCVAFSEGMFLDVIEIDAASNRGIDQARELIEASRFQPTAGKYKIYIVDEVHMLTKEAFNALLKTLEEPPEHVRFILATTNVEKVLETVVSRTERYDFRSIPLQDMVERLEYIAKEEGIKYEQKALELIAKIAKGGLRDAIVLFEQYAHAGALTYEIVADHLLATDDSFKTDFFDAFRYKDSEKLLSLVASLRDDSKDMRLFSEEMFVSLKDGLIRSIGSPDFPAYEQCFALFESFYAKSKGFHDPYLLLEVMALRACHGSVVIVPTPKAAAPAARLVPTPSPASRPVPVSVPKPKVLASAPVPDDGLPPFEEDLPPDFFDSPAAQAAPAPAPVPAPARVIDAFDDPSESSATAVPPADFDYFRLVEYIKKIPKRSFVAMSMQSSSYAFANDQLIIKVTSDFHLGKLDTPEIKTTIADAVLHLFGTAYTVEVRKGGSPLPLPKRPAPAAPAAPSAPAPGSALADDAEDIF